MIQYDEIKNRELLRLFQNSAMSSNDLSDDDYFEIQRYSYNLLRREVLARMNVNEVN